MVTIIVDILRPLRFLAGCLHFSSGNSFGSRQSRGARLCDEHQAIAYSRIGFPFDFYGCIAIGLAKLWNVLSEPAEIYLYLPSTADADASVSRHVESLYCNWRTPFEGARASATATVLGCELLGRRGLAWPSIHPPRIPIQYSLSHSVFIHISA